MRGVHECYWQYLLEEAWIGGGELEKGDAFVTDNLACHHNLLSIGVRAPRHG